MKTTKIQIRDILGIREFKMNGESIELSGSNGIKIPVCDDEHNMSGGIRQIHNNSAAEKLSKIAGQLAWEKEYYHKLYGYENDPAREAFRKRYGRSYL